VDVVQQRIEVAPPRPTSRGINDWVTLLQDLTQRLDSGRIYDRDLDALRDPVAALAQAVNRRTRLRT
jgi:hypothetical protein